MPAIVHQLDLDQRPGNRGWRGLTAQTRGAKIDLLAAAGGAGAPAVSVLRTIAEEDEILFVRARAAHAIWRITGEHGDAVKWLAGLVDLGIDRQDDYVVETAAFALKAMGTDARPAIPPLVRALGIAPRGIVGIYGGHRCRVAAAEALHAIGAPAIPPLVQALGSDSKDQRWGIRSAFSSFGIDAVKPLIACLDDPRRAADAVWTLGRIGEPAEAALPALRRLLASASKDLRPDVAEAIRRIEGR